MPTGTPSREFERIVITTELLPDREDAVLTVSGHVDAPGANQIAGLVRSLSTSGVRHLLLDLSDVPTCSEHLADLLDDGQRTLHASGGWLVPIAPAGKECPRGHDVPLDELFTVYRNARDRAAARTA